MTASALHILIFDEDQSAVARIRSAFAASNIDTLIHAATEIEEAKLLLSSATPQLIIAGGDFSDRNGLGHLIEGGILPQRPFIYLAETNDEQTLQEAASWGAAEVVLKNADSLDRLPDRIEQVLDEWDRTSERQYAVKLLRQHESQLQAVFDCAAVVILVLDYDGKIIRANREALRKLGYSESELLNMTHLDISHPDDVRQSLELRQKLTRGEIAQYHFEKRYRRKDGTYFWGAASVSPYRNSRGRIEGMMGIIIDITESRRAEAEAKASQESLLQLEREAKERAEEELERLRERLIRQAQLAAIGQFSASVAHELRNPLSVILNAAYVLKKKLSESQPDLERHAKTIEREANLAARIINELLAMSQGHAPSKRHFELDAILASVRDQFAANSSLLWNVSMSPQPFTIFGDPILLEQVLRNVVSNAVQAMNAEGTISVAASRTGEFDEITIRDDGPGVSPEMREEIFEPLFTTKRHGAGLGLAICRQIIEQHGGTIELLPVAPGATFCIRLPRE